MLADALTLDLMALFIVFCRLGGALMVMPGFGEGFVSPRVRLLLALTLSIVLAPLVTPLLPADRALLAGYLPLVAGELAVGFFIGVTARLLMSALQVAGTMIAFQASMANAFSFDVVSAQQGALAANFLGILGMVLIFVTDLHHLMLRALVDSYVLFPPGVAPPMGDFADTAARLVAESFRIGVQFAAPFVLVGVLMTLGTGLLARLMPQVQVFFVMMPLQITMGMLIFGLVIGAGMMWFVGRWESAFVELFGPL